MKSRLLCFILVNTISCIAFAQKEQQEINAIKSSLNYLYAMGTSFKSQADADENAKALLSLEIEQYLKDNAITDAAGYVTKAQEKISVINTRRGNLFRVFVYVKKVDILPYYNEEKVIHEEFNTMKSVNNSNIQTQNEPKTNRIVPDTQKQILSSREKEMLNIHTINDLNDYVNKGRKDRVISQVGKYSNLPKEGEFYVFIIRDQQGEIIAILKVNNTKIVNLKTRDTDSYSNYMGSGAIWVMFNK